MAASLQARGLSKEYHLGSERLRAVSDVSLEVYPGEMVAILGRPGSGKSMLLHLLGCLQRPDSGELRIEGQETTRLDDEELARIRVDKIGFMFQAFNLLPDETTVVNVELALRHQHLSARESRRKAEAALRTVGLENRFAHTPSRLSPRQRQCIDMARALVNDPAVILSDEPIRGLDSSSREEVMGLFQKLNDEGRTLIITTPDTAIGAYCRRVVSLAEGKLVADKLVSNRRIIPPSRIPGTPSESETREEEVVCPRCNYGNSEEAETCRRCDFTLHLTKEEQQSIESRLSSAEGRWLGVESASDDGAVAGQELIDEAKEVPFFSGLGAKSLLKVVCALEPHHFTPGSVIVKEGDEGDSFYVVRSGSVEVFKKREGGPDISLAQRGPKDGFGEMALLADEPRSATVIATSEVDVWRLPKEAFQELLRENPALYLYFNRLLAQRLGDINERIHPAIEFR